ncbi:cation:dicarboxylase symporter family transporter [Streptomyces sp. NBS 14/10]|uniref:cation:dicarboxylate symporter family transporter n=1 Tax=Streptomyces sp. NBS 14/10 TaxID=1945643 RepID=UPI000B9C8693|nr:cation:dicarboxylase symporter family transporter [Streptomyces sp. NBS 14/10]KAK1178354.1 cation:dicarboxylase symporter family transporter [Streptomyces sp. NBS 14/10]
MRSQEQLLDAASPPPAARKRWYRGLGAQVVIAMALGVAVGFAFPGFAVDLKIMGDLFLALIKAGVAPLVFFTVVMGIASAGDLKKASRLGFLALIYFEVVSTLALLLGLVAANLFGVGKDAGGLTSGGGAAPAPSAGEGEHGVLAFLRDIVPDNFVGAFSSGQLLQVVLVAVLFGIGLLALKPQLQEKINSGLEVVSEAFFAFVNVVMKLAPIGAFGAIAYSVGTSGSKMLLALTELVLQYWLVVAVFVFGILGLVCLIAGFNIWRILRYVRVEMTLVLGTASSEAALPGLLKKLTRIGCSKQSVGLVVPTGYAFNLDGTSLYMSICTLFVANAYGIPMGIPEQLGLLLIMLLTSKGAATVSGGTFVVFTSTVAATGTLPVEGTAVLFGVYRFMSMATAFCNTFGNVVATFVLAKWCKEMDVDKVQRALADPAAFLAQSESESESETETETESDSGVDDASRAPEPAHATPSITK